MSDERSSKTAASLAGKTLADPNATPAAKSLAGSVLTQAPDREAMASGTPEPSAPRSPGDAGLQGG